MKQFVIIAFILLAVGCKPGKKDNPVQAANDDSSLLQHTPETTERPSPPSGKIDIESFGDIKLGQPYLETLKVLGEPDTKSKAEEWGADGMMHEDWTWKTKGLVLNMSADKNNVSGSMAVFSIRANAPCNFKTRAGIGIGSNTADVQEAYKRDINPEESNQEQITVGSVYGGILFTLKNDKVKSIFLGAAAE